MKAVITYASDWSENTKRREEEIKQLEDLLQILKEEGKCIVDLNEDNTLLIQVYDWYVE